MFRTTTRSLALLLAVLAAALFVVASPAEAGEYPPPEDCAVAVDDDSPEPGDTITITGESWPAGAEVTVLFGDDEVGTTTAGEDGTWSFEYTIPADLEEGDYAVSAEGCETGEVLGTTVTVEEGAAPADIPRTGSNSTEPLVRTGAVLLAAGAVLVYAVRRRSQAVAGS